MIRRFCLWPVILCAACSRSPAHVSTIPASAYSFHAIGHSANGRLIESLVGRADVFDDEIRVVVTGGFAQLQSLRTQRPRGLSAGLAFCRFDGRWAGHWDFRSESSIVPIHRIRTRGDTLTDSITFILKRPKNIDLRDHWLTIQQHADLLLPGEVNWRKGATSPVHSQPFVFDPDSSRRALMTRRCNEDR